MDRGASFYVYKVPAARVVAINDSKAFTEHVSDFWLNSRLREKCNAVISTKLILQPSHLKLKMLKPICLQICKGQQASRRQPGMGQAWRSLRSVGSTVLLGTI